MGEGGAQGGGIPQDEGVESVREAEKERAESCRVRKLHNIAYRFTNEKKGKELAPNKNEVGGGIKDYTFVPQDNCLLQLQIKRF